jgi:hypothetical protein
MSKKRIPTFCLVIDCSIAHAAGSAKSKGATGIQCREFLMGVRGVCHRMAWNPAIKDEWDRHQSAFTMQWLASMTKLKKLRNIGPSESAELRGRIAEACADENVAAIILKDWHLVDAALATDMRVASLDDAVRGHLSNLASDVECLQTIIWVNPAIAGERAIEWLEQGAPMQKKRLL